LFPSLNSNHQDNREFAAECDFWVGSFDNAAGKMFCGDFNDGKARVRHNAESVSLEQGPQSQIADCSGTLVNAVLDVVFSRPYGTPDASCSYVFLNATRNCDRAVRLTGNQTVLFAYHASDVCLPNQCTGQHAPSVKLSFDWRRSYVRPAMMVPTAAPPLSRFVPPRSPPILRAVNPANPNATFFEASWSFDESSKLLQVELFALTNGWVAIGFRADDALKANAHLKTRMFIAWFDDVTGHARVIEAVSQNTTSAPTALLSSSSSAVVASSLQGSILQGGTAIRFAVRVADWKGPTDALDDDRLRLPRDKAPLIHWAVGTADPTVSPNGTCVDPAFGNGARHRYCYLPHKRSLAERGLATDLVVLGGGVALRDDEGRFAAQPDTLFAVVWRKLNDTAFRFRMSAVTTGYVSVGWRSDAALDGWHKQSDMITGWIDERGEPRIVDTWSDNLLQPLSDGAQNVVLVGGSSKGGVLTIEFDRLIKTGDAMHDVDVRDGDVLLQWATFTKAPTVAAADVCDDPLFCYGKHANMQQVGSGVVNFFRVGAISAPPAGTFDEVTAGDWLAIFLGICLVIAVMVRIIDRCLCSRGHKGAPATGGVGMSSMRESRVADAAVATEAVENVDDDPTHATGSLSQDDYAKYIERVNKLLPGDDSEASFPAPETPISDYGHTPADLRYHQYGHLMPDETYRRLPLAPRPVIMLRGNDVMYAADGVAPSDDSGADAWGYDASVDGGGSPAPPPAEVRTEGNADYGRIDPHMFRKSAQLSGSKEYTTVAPKLKSNSALYGAITQMSPLSLAVRPSPFQRFLTLFQRRLWGEASVGDCLLVLLYLALHVAAAAASGQPLVSVLDWANLFGYLSIGNALAVALPATRNSLLGFLLGTAFDRTIMFHRWIGRWIVVLILVHAILYLPAYLPDSFDTLISGAQGLENLWGVIATVASLVLLFSSLEYIRRRHFEKFFWIHYSYVPFYIFCALHSPVVGLRLVLVAVAAFVLDRLVRLFWGLWPRRTVRVIVKGGDMLCVMIPRHPLAKYAVGSYIFVSFMGIAFFQWHPFTLSSGPNDELLEIHIKSLGDHTRQLVERAKAQGEAARFWVRVDGPYGHVTFDHRRFAYVLLVGAGVGVTPCIAALKDIYRVRMSEAMRGAKPQQNAAQVVHLVWSCKNPQHLEWFIDVLKSCADKVTKDESRYPQLVIDIFMSENGPNNQWDESKWPEVVDGAVLHGAVKIHMRRVSAADTMKKAVKMMKKKKIESGLTIACGPTALVSSFWDEAVRATLNNGVIMRCHFERFDW
jgi:predicted ferric reductase